MKMKLTGPDIYKMSVIAANLERRNSGLGRMRIRMIVIPNINMEIVVPWVLGGKIPNFSFLFCR